ncbi:hypothetical protein SteCoe_37119 [Stentor coeruleus]|uniref:Kinesin motor domain-containing protein n=1 Tax=Stentor coeruleus TaxID=5963 RepID=A0A1R2ANM8_9CILI|nr:hypothetical protein SteCoe_37119 [Stentor coeruleus]
MNTESSVPLDIQQAFCPDTILKSPSLNFLENNKKASIKPIKMIEEQLYFLEKLKTLNSCVNDLLQKSQKKFKAKSEQLQDSKRVNLEINKRNALSAERDAMVKDLCDKLCDYKCKNSQIIASNQALNAKIEATIKINNELLAQKQIMLNEKAHKEDTLNKLEEENNITIIKLEDCNEKTEIHKTIIESHTSALNAYQKKRVEAYTEIKKLNNYLQELKGNIRVFCRIRPKLPADKNDIAKIDISERTITVYKGVKPSKFSFDRVFGPNDTIYEIFEEISQLVQNALDGYKVCIFAYGQTGSGKTYTMEGPSEEIKDRNSTGLIQKSVELMFTTTEKLKQIGWEYKFYASTIEIYNEQVRDLQNNRNVISTNSTAAINPTKIEISSYKDLIPILSKARKERAIAETECNINSSRSHFIFQLNIYGEKGDDMNEGILNLIDLAGSERIKVSKVEGDRLEEAKAINKSLSSLGDVIHALVKKDKHIPFRNSRLTLVLKHCLGGDGKTLMFVNISPFACNFKETVNSLVFAQKVNSCILN